MHKLVTRSQRACVFKSTHIYCLNKHVGASFDCYDRVLTGGTGLLCRVFCYCVHINHIEQLCVWLHEV